VADFSEALVGKMVRCTHGITFVGIVRELEYQGRGRARKLVAVRVQRPGVLAVTPNAICRGALVRVPLERVDGIVNRRKTWPHQIERLNP